MNGYQASTMNGGTRGILFTDQLAEYAAQGFSHPGAALRIHDNSQVSLKPFSTPQVNIKAVESKGVPSGVWVTGAPAMWDQGFFGQGCLVGIIDSGIDETHPDLQGRVRIKYDYVGKSELNIHGTHVAGTIAATGKAGIQGVAPKAYLADYRVLDKEGSGSGEDVTKAIIQATNDGCNIINMSLGSPDYDYQMHQAIKYAVTKNVLVVVAVGNEGPNTQSYPGFLPEVLGVGAVEFDIKKGGISGTTFSSTNKEVDVCADGYQVLSTVPKGGYRVLSGTSMATPHVAGVAALLFSKANANLLRNPTEPEVYLMLKMMAIDVLAPGIDDAAGAGFVTFHNQLPVIDPTRAKWVLPSLEYGAPPIATMGDLYSAATAGDMDSHLPEMISFNYEQTMHLMEVRSRPLLHPDERIAATESMDQLRKARIGIDTILEALKTGHGKLPPWARAYVKENNLISAVNKYFNFSSNAEDLIRSAIRDEVPKITPNFIIDGIVKLTLLNIPL